ncbi:MAG: HvfC/BufC family peptide modification chaperone, partial [Gammaproteobacteria bacterium]
MSSAAISELAQLQALLYRLIVAPDGVAEALANDGGGINLESIIVGDARLTAVERAAIYADAYFYRLLDVLKEDFPATLAVTGEDEFHNLITGYLIAHPSTEPSLLYAGCYLADYLDQPPMLARWPFIGDLVRLERALIESFHAADAPALERAAVQSIPPHQWPALLLKLHPATHLLRLQWRVEEIVRAGDQNSTTTEAAAAPVTMLVWRRHARVFYRTAEAAEEAALNLIEYD